MKKLHLLICIIFMHICIFSSYSIAQSPAINISCSTPLDCSYALPSPNLSAYIASMSNFSSCSNGSLCKYKWEVTNGIIVASNTTTYEGNGANGITVKWNNVNGNGTVKVTTDAPSSGGSGCSDCPVLTQTKTLPIRYLGTPGNIKINGTGYVSSYILSCGTAPITVSIDPVTNATSYDWAIPSGWSQSGTGNSRTLTPHVSSSGIINVTVSRGDVPNLTTSSQLSITRPLPIINTVTSNDVTFCNTTQTISPGATGTNADKFRWEPTGGVKVNGSTAAQIVAGNVTVSATATGTYKVQAYSTTCQAASTNYITKNVFYGAPATPTGTVNGGPQQVPNVVTSGAYLVLYSPPGQYSYNWVITNGTGYLYPGTNSANATPNPFIRVEGRVSNVCGMASTAFYLSNQPMGYMLAPNPVKDGKLTIIFEDELYVSELVKNITLYDENQKQLVQYDNSSKKSKNTKEISLDVSKIKGGQYYLHIAIGDKLEKEIVVIQ